MMINMTPSRLSLSLIVGSLVLAGCGGSKDNNNTTVDYSKLEQTPLSEKALVIADSDQLDRHIKNGIRLTLTQGSPMRSLGLPELAFTDAVAAPNAVSDDSLAGGSSGNSDNFSATNVHVSGVDEADYAKYDGQHWFIATSPQYANNQVETGPGIRIFATDPSTPNASYVSDFPLDKQWGAVSELYLVGNDQNETTEVAAIRNEWGNVYPFFPLGDPEPAFATDALIWPGPVNSKIRIQTVDVSDPSSPSESWEMSMDGSLVASRKIDNTLYLITRYDPWLPILHFDFGDKNIQDENEDILATTPVSQLMPSYSINGGESRPLTDRCFIQSDVSDYHGFGSLVNVTAIDLANHRVVDSTCANIAVGGIYMSPTSLYIGGSDYSPFFSHQGKTVIHKFGVDGSGMHYKASGAVPGHLNWRDPSFSMDEYKERLRVVTTSRSDRWEPIHQLSILEENTASKGLDIIASLPNTNEPDPIGKPNEDIYAVRFAEERAYIVTFRRIDPLYVLDLADPFNPSIAGELEIPGFSTYLHPINDNYVFSVGNDADEFGRTTGLKVSLFDVADMTQPQLAGSELIGLQGSYSEALNNLKALSFLSTSESQIRVTLPVTVYSMENSTRSYPSWDHTGLYLFEINDIDTPRASLKPNGAIISETASSAQTYPTREGVDRGILHDDAVFYTHGNSVWAAHWDNPSQAVGPISAPTLCTLELRPALEITLEDPFTSNTALCEATVIAQDQNSDFEEQLSPISGTEPGTCAFAGVFERQGTYNVSVNAKGYLPTGRDDIIVTADECHVNTQHVDIELQPDNVVCTAVVINGLSVTVNSDASVAAACDATVVAIDGNYREILTSTEEAHPVPNTQCVFYGAAERAGNYTLEVSLSGHETEVIENILVEGDLCHVTTREIDVNLTTGN